MDYHQSTAQLWERQALIKALAVSGPAKMAEEINSYINQLAYDADLDDNISSEIARLRERMEKELAKESETSFNIKTGRGGMVDVEFLTQYFQLKYGGQDATLRETNTLKALQKVNEAGILSDSDYENLRDGYKFLRRLENMLRLVHDQSINEISNQPGYLRKLAMRLDYNGEAEQIEDQLLNDYRSWTESIRAIFNRHLQINTDKPEQQAT